jgi:hypothetical protein
MLINFPLNGNALLANRILKCSGLSTGCASPRARHCETLGADAWTRLLEATGPCQLERTEGAPPGPQDRREYVRAIRGSRSCSRCRSSQHTRRRTSSGRTVYRSLATQGRRRPDYPELQRPATTSSRLTAGYRESLTTARKADSFGMSSAACRPPPLPKPYASVGDEGHMSLAQALAEKAGIRAPAR